MKPKTTKTLERLYGFQFGLRWMFFAIFVVSLPLAALRYRSYQVDEFNRGLKSINESRGRNGYGLMLQDDVPADWFTRLATKNRPLRVASVGVYFGDVNRALDELSAVGVTRIGMIELDPYLKHKPIGVHDDTIKNLARFQIESLLWSRPLSARQMEDLGRIEGLSFLYLSGDWVDDELFSHIGSNDSLIDLRVYSERLTEKCLDVLDRFPQLERFHFSSSPSVTPEAIDAYSKRRIARYPKFSQPFGYGCQSGSGIGMR